MDSRKSVALICQSNYAHYAGHVKVFFKLYGSISVYNSIFYTVFPWLQKGNGKFSFTVTAKFT